MRTFRRILVILYLIFNISEMPYRCIEVKGEENLFIQNHATVVDVVLYDFKDKYISLVKQNLEEIQNQNKGKVKFNFYDSKGNQAIQNEILSNLENNVQDILLINLVDTKATQEVIDRFKQRGIPIIFFNREPLSTEAIKSYEKAYYVGTNAKEAGNVQGQILVNLWNNKRTSIDINNNGVLQYAILRGPQNNIEAQERTEFSIKALEKAGIPIAQIASTIGNWERDLARTNISALFLQYNNRIEAIIANNDEMAIGAIEALQKYGYNLGDPKKTIAVVGVDAIPEAQELIKNGRMAGSVFQDPSEMAKAIYTIGLNVFKGNPPLLDTQYKFDETGKSVRLPYKEYIG